MATKGGVRLLVRYASEQMRSIWSEQAAHERWRQVELAVLDARVLLGEAPESAVAAARAAPPPDEEEVRDAEKRTRHDVIAFLETWTKKMPDEAASWVHRGLTSSDIVDTALALALRAASQLLLDGTTKLVHALGRHALAHRDTPRVGRTHGMHATADLWGHRVADIALAADRARIRLARAAGAVAQAKLSGPTGTYARVTADVELRAAALLGLPPVDVATQVVMRDRMADWMCALALLASVCEAFALEVRHGQRSEVAELAEGVREGQFGSSAMPHKRNPVSAEKICGLSRVVRSYVTPVMEGVALWHERDISHSSVERVCLPDASALVEHIVLESTALVDMLVVDNERMAATLSAARPHIDSEQALTVLMAAGMRREIAYRHVRELVSTELSIDDFERAVREVARVAGLQVNKHWLDEPEAPPAQRLAYVFERVTRLLD